MRFVSSNKLDTVQALKKLETDFGHVIMHIMALLSLQEQFVYKKKGLHWSIIMIDHPCDRIESILVALYTFYDFIVMSEDGELTCTQFLMQYTLGKERPTYVVCGWICSILCLHS
jgi:hypothetical protein